MHTTATLLDPTPTKPRTDQPADRLGLFGLLGRILRHREGFFDDIFEGKRVGAQIASFLLVIVSLTALYGLTMGSAGFHPLGDTVAGGGAGWEPGLKQIAASAVKVPLLFLSSLMVCLPVLFIVLVLMGAKLTFGQTSALILLALALSSILLCSCAPIVLFFTFTGSNYHFIKLLHVGIFAFSGIWGMLALSQGLHAACEKSELWPKQSIRILQVWILVFGFVGTQMAWSLRPFVGDPDKPFQLFRTEQGGNFYVAVWNSVVDLGK